MTQFAESIVEDAALAWPEALGYEALHSPNIAACMLGAERSDPNERDMMLPRNRAGHQRLENAQFSYGGHV